MSQYPSPYVPPNITAQYGGPPDSLKPARRASLMMFIVGPLMILFAGCMIGITFAFGLVPPDKFNPLRDTIEKMAHMSPELFFRSVGTIVMIFGVMLLALAFFVRRGGVFSTYMATFVVGLILLQQLLSFAAAIVNPMNADGVGNVCGSIITLSIFTMLFVWLISAARAAPKVKSAQQQYLSQYWQYQQNMQAYTTNPTQPPAQGYATSNEPPVPPPSAG
jgi:hypothetical protein